MDDSDDPLAQPAQALDAHGRTVDEAVTEEITANGDVLNDWLNAKDRHSGHVSVYSKYTPTPKTERTPPKEIPDPATQTAAERYRGKKPPQERGEPKAGACIYPRLKFRPNDPSTGGWGK